MQVTPLVESKLMPPTPAPTYMRRAAFVKKMKQADRVKLTLLHSGAGYGKTSGLAMFFHDTALSFSWYSVTAEDDGIFPFLHYLVKSIRRVIPSFGHTMTEWEESFRSPKEAEVAQWLALFVNELCQVEQPFFIVIDDFHHVDHVFFINYIMEKLIGLLPPNVHLIVATRNVPRWSTFIKLKATGQLVELKETDFMFTEEEVAVFYEDYFERTLTEEEAASIVSLTEGWAIAINLLAIHLTEGEVPIATAMKPALHELFAYLSDDVFQRMSADTRQWMMAFSIFSTITETLVDAFYGKDAVRMLKSLAEGHIFIQSMGEGNYRFHALFQQFLERKWKSMDQQQYATVQKEAATFFLHKGEVNEAMSHAVKSGDAKFMSEMIVEHGSAFIQSGQFEWLLDILKELPLEVRRHYYVLFFYEGEAYRYLAFYEKAREAYLTCIEYGELQQDAYALSRAHAGIAHIYLDTIQPASAEHYLREAIRYAQQDQQTTPLEMARLKRQFAENLVNLGKARAAAEWVQQEQIEEKVLQEGNLDARLALRTGRLEEARSILLTRVDQFSLPDAHRETDVLLSLICSMTGQAEQALQTAIRGIQLGVSEKSGFVEAVGKIRRGHAEVLADPFDWETPKAFYQEAIERMEALAVPRGKAEPAMGLSLLYAREGRFAEAIAYGEAGLRETEKVHDGWLSGLIRIGLSIVHCYAGDVEKAKHHLDAAQKLFKGCGDTFGEMVVAFWQMAVATHTTIFQEAAHTFFTHSTTYPFFLTTRTMFSPFDIQMLHPLVLRSKSIMPTQVGVAQAMKILHLEDYPNHPGYSLSLQAFGPFVLHLGFTEVEDRSWQRDKAKELLLYLVIHRNRFVPKEEICQALWPQADAKQADRDFKVALNHLLKVIEPNRNAREKSYFILRRQTMYQLNPHAGIHADFLRFHQYKEAGFQEKVPELAMVQLLKAARLYKGKLFEEKRSTDWLLAERDQYEQHYLHILERLAQTSIRLRQYTNTLTWAEQLVRLDPTWEEAYRLLMYAHYQLHNRTQSIRWYERCKTMLQDEFGIAPMETTEEMYKMIMHEL